MSNFLQNCVLSNKTNQQQNNKFIYSKKKDGSLSRFQTHTFIQELFRRKWSNKNDFVHKSQLNRIRRDFC